MEFVLKLKKVFLANIDVPPSTHPKHQQKTSRY